MSLETQLYAIAGEVPLLVRPVDVASGSAKRRLLESYLIRDIGLLPCDMLRLAESERCRVFAADLEGYGTGGFIIVNVSQKDRGTTGIVWVTVAFGLRGRHIGRTLVQHVIRYSVMLKASTVEVTKGSATRMFLRMNFALPSHGHTTAIVTRKHALCLALPKCSELQPLTPREIATGEVRIRYATESDRRSCSHLVLAASKYTIGAGNNLQDILDSDFRAVAERGDGEVISLVAVCNTGWINFLAVSPDFQSRGLGSFMLFVGLEWLRLQGVQSARLQPLNARAGQFYLRWNFSVQKCATKGKLCQQVMARDIDERKPLLGDEKALTKLLKDDQAVAEVDAECNTRKRARSPASS